MKWLVALTLLATPATAQIRLQYLGSYELPLFFVSSGEINAQLPFELQGRTTANLQVFRAGQLSASVPVSLSSVAPAIFTVSGDGKGAGAILRARDFRLLTSTSPAATGDAIINFCTGLGAVSPGVASEAPAASSPRSRTTQTPTVSIGGRADEVLFSGGPGLRRALSDPSFRWRRPPGTVCRSSSGWAGYRATWPR